MWSEYEAGSTIGTYGSESGEIVQDIEYNGEARITVECCERYYAITVGVYGVMVHTAFCNGGEYPEWVKSMKVDIEDFLSKERSLQESGEFGDMFFNKY